MSAVFSKETMKNFKHIVLCSALLLSLASCFTNPVTGRRSLNLVDEGTMRSMANQEYASFLSTNRPVNGSRDAEMVDRIGKKMSVAVQNYLQSIGQTELVNGWQWQFNLVNNNQANAWCMPGGKVVVYSGILPLTQNEAGLATVMGHEIAHAVARHGNERMSQQLAAQAGGQTLSALIGTKPGVAGQLFNTAIGLGSQGVLLKFSRDQESEADKMGLIFMALAGYNPNEAVNFWSRMAAKGGQQPPEFLSTHPSDQTRINNIKKWLPEAMKYYKPQ